MKADIRRQRHEKVIAALLATSTREEAAEKLGINSRTIRRYFDDPEFLKLYTEATKGIISNSTQQIQKSLSPAITTLKAIVEDKDANIHARVSAARSLLEYGIRLTEINDNEVYWVDLIDGFFYIDGRSYSPDQFAEWCDLHEHSIVILDDI